jgi:hypothetical protein
MPRSSIEYKISNMFYLLLTGASRPGPPVFILLLWRGQMGVIGPRATQQLHNSRSVCWARKVEDVLRAVDHLVRRAVVASMVTPMSPSMASVPVCLSSIIASISITSAPVLPTGPPVPSLVPALPWFGAWGKRAILGSLPCSGGWVFSSSLSWYIAIVHAHLDVCWGYGRGFSSSLSWHIDIFHAYRDVYWGCGWVGVGARQSWVMRECPRSRFPRSLSLRFFVHLLIPVEILRLERVIRHLKTLV